MKHFAAILLAGLCAITAKAQVSGGTVDHENDVYRCNVQAAGIDCASSAGDTFHLEVKPKARPHWKRIAFKAAVLAGTSVLQYKATTYCQRGNVETCNVGYGSRRAFNWFSIGMGAAMIPLSEKCQNDDGPKPVCYGLAYGVPAMQTAFGIHDFLSYSPKENHEKATLRSFTRARPF